MDNSYLSIAINDYEYLQETRNMPYYNNVAFTCQEVCEKLLKAVIEKAVPDASDELRISNLRILYNRVSEHITISPNHEVDLGVISAYCKNVRYPGVDFVEVSKRNIECLLSVTDELYEVVTEWFRNKCNQAQTPDVLINLAKDINPSG